MYDVVVIGCGVAGMSAALYLKRSGLSVLIVEHNAPGGQINKTSKIENYLGYTTIDGPTLAYNMFMQINSLKIDYMTDEVINIKTTTKNKTVVMKKKEITAKNIVIATGRSPKKLGSENEEKFIGKGISYCTLCDAQLYKGKNVMIIGGGNTALEEAIYISKIANHTTLVNRTGILKADKILVDEFNLQPNTDILFNKSITAFNGEEILSSVTIKDNITKKEEEKPIDGVFIHVGYGPNNDFLNRLDILNENGYIKVNKKMETKVKGIYACGDVIKKDIYQIITASAEGVTAAISIQKNKR